MHTAIRITRSVLLTAFLSASPALAAGPALVLDDGSVAVSLKNDSGRGDKEMKYGFRVSGRVMGKPAPSDRLRADFKKGGKTLASVRCEVNQRDKNFQCENADAALKVTGPVDIALTYLQDATDKEIPLRTLHLKVVDVKEPGVKNTMRPAAQIDVGGVPGTAVAYLTDQETESKPTFVFWRGVAPGEHDRLPEEDVRCLVNGKRLPGKITFDVEHDEPIEWTVNTPHGAKTAKIKRYSIGFMSLARIGEKFLKHAGPEFVVMNRNPGDWVCQYRSEGELVREFRFKVNAEGWLAPHPEQSGPNALNFPPGATLLEQKFGAPKLNHAFSAAGVQAEAFFGRPWSKAPATQAMLKSLQAK
jgi:hypothetical protein